MLLLHEITIIQRKPHRPTMNKFIIVHDTSSAIVHLLRLYCIVRYSNCSPILEYCNFSYGSTFDRTVKTIIVLLKCVYILYQHNII